MKQQVELQESAWHEGTEAASVSGESIFLCLESPSVCCDTMLGESQTHPKARSSFTLETRVHTDADRSPVWEGSPFHPACVWMQDVVHSECIYCVSARTEALHTGPQWKANLCHSNTLLLWHREAISPAGGGSEEWCVPTAAPVDPVRTRLWLSHFQTLIIPDSNHYSLKIQTQWLPWF